MKSCFDVRATAAEWINGIQKTSIKSDVSNNLQGVVKQLIPPKGIKRNSEEVSEFLE